MLHEIMRSITLMMPPLPQNGIEQESQDRQILKGNKGHIHTIGNGGQAPGHSCDKKHNIDYGFV